MEVPLAGKARISVEGGVGIPLAGKARVSVEKGEKEVEMGLLVCPLE